MQLRPLLPPRCQEEQREGAAGGPCSAGGGCQAAGARPGGPAASDHGHGAPSRPVPGAAALGPSLPRPERPGAAGSGGCAHHGPHHRGGRPLPRLLSGGGAHLARSCHRRRAAPAPPQPWSATPPRCRHRSRPGEGRARPEGAAAERGQRGRAGRGPAAPGRGRRRGPRAGKFFSEWRSVTPARPGAGVPRTPRAGGTRCRPPSAPGGVPGCRGARPPRAAGPDTPAHPSPAPRSRPRHRAGSAARRPGQCPAPGARMLPRLWLPAPPRLPPLWYLRSSEPRNAFRHVRLIMHCCR